MYFPPRNISCFEIDSKKIRFILKMINKSLNKINIQHEWGNISSSFLFSNSQNNNLNNININIDEINIKNRGDFVEHLLYGRILIKLNIKESIYILNNNNYQKSLQNFILDFKNLDNFEIEEVFEKAMENKNIDNSVIKAFEEYKKMNKKMKAKLKNYAFIVKK